MSIIGTFNTGVSGINTYSAAIATDSDNISNSQTVGYKQARDTFASLVGPLVKTTTSRYSEGGSQAILQRFVAQQGSLEVTNGSTDFAVQGAGFFAVASSVNATTATVPATAQRLLTRAGDFHVDQNGFVVDGTGQTLLGAAVGSGTGTTFGTTFSNLVPVQFPAANATTPVGNPSSKVTLNSILPATATAGTTVNAPATIYDATGGVYNLNLAFTKASAGTWTLTVPSATQTNAAAGATPVTATVTAPTTTLTFNPATGALAQPTGGIATSVALSNGQTLAISVNLGTAAGGNLTQGATQFSVGNIQTDGSLPGVRTGFTISADGRVQETLSNGQKIDRYRIPLVTVANPNGLEAIAKTAFAISETSGAAVTNTAGSNGTGVIKGGALEASTVDLAQQFTDIIQNQAAYNANTKVISTADQMYQRVTNLGR